MEALGLMARRSPEPFPEREVLVFDGITFLVLHTLTGSGSLLHHGVEPPFRVLGEGGPRTVEWITYRPNRVGD